MKRKIFGLSLLLVAVTCLGVVKKDSSAKLEISGKDIPTVVKDALANLAEEHMLDIPGRGPLTQDDIFMLPKLKPWIEDKGYKSLDEDDKTLLDSLSFVKISGADGLVVMPPFLPVYIRQDTDFYLREVSALQITRRDYMAWVFSGIIVHELTHARGELLEVPAYDAQLKALRKLQWHAPFDVERRADYLSLIEQELEYRKKMEPKVASNAK